MDPLGKAINKEAGILHTPATDPAIVELRQEQSTLIFSSFVEGGFHFVELFGAADDPLLLLFPLRFHFV